MEIFHIFLVVFLYKEINEKKQNTNGDEYVTSAKIEAGVLNESASMYCTQSLTRTDRYNPTVR